MISYSNNKNKLLTIALIIVIIFSIFVLIYVNIPLEEEIPKTSEPEVLLTLVYMDQYLNYTLEDLQNLETYSGYGGYKTKYPSIKGPFEYTGVNVTTILKQINNLPENYTLRVTSSDEWISNYTLEEINGKVTIYNNSGYEMGIGNVTMLLAFMESGDYNFSDGPLRIAYINNGTHYTDSFLWSKYVMKMEIVSG